MRPVRMACDQQLQNMLVVELTADEMQELRPEDRRGRLSLMFLRDYVQLVDLDIAQALSYKYPFLHIVDGYGNRIDQADDLDAIEGSETRRLAHLFRIAADYDIDAVGMTAYEIKLAIRNARNETALYAGLSLAEAGTFHNDTREA